MDDVLVKQELRLTQNQKDNYEQDGFLVLQNFIPNEICEKLIKQARKITEENYDPIEIKTVFSTLDQRHARSQYFLESGDKIRCFFEENAFNNEGQLITDISLSINKIGHAVHDLDPIFNQFSRSPKIAALAKNIGIIDPLLVQSMYIFKQPHIGGEVHCHQDATYLYVKNQPITGFWFALEDATIANGCLWAIPGGHRTPLKSRFLLDHNHRASTEVYDNSPWPMEKLVPLEVPRGSLIVLHGLSPHLSRENRTEHSRHAYTLHLMSGKGEYLKDNWLQRPEDLPFKGF